MRTCTRNAAPPLIVQYGVEIGIEYAERRAQDPAYRFQWPRRDNKSIYDEAYEALHRLTNGRCAYCDGHPIDATGEDQIDHFRPKTRPEFYTLVCDWGNLFLTCSACNKAKLQKWELALLRPDEEGFKFERYFIYRTDTGELNPSPSADQPDQLRAERTIELLNLNRSGACIARRNAVKLMIAAQTDAELSDIGYHFLIPLCRAA